MLHHADLHQLCLMVMNLYLEQGFLRSSSENKIPHIHLKVITSGMKTEPRINRPCFELLITLNKKGNTTGGKKNVTQSCSLKSFWTHITNYKIICPFKHPASKFNVNSLSVNGGRGRAGQGLREGETVIMKNPNNNKMPTPKLKEWPGTLLCNQSLQSLESLRTLYNSEKLSKSWELETNDVILQLRAN